MTRRNIDVRPYSRLVLDGVKQTPSRAMLRAVGFAGRDFRKPQVGIASTWSNVTPCNMHIDKLADCRSEGRRRGGRQEHDLRHDHRLRRHLDGHAGHALFARLARGHRRFDRDGRRRARLRRPRRDRRLRQEHARLHDGDRAARPAGGVRLRRHDPPGREAARRRLRFRGGRCARRRQDRRRSLREVERTAIPGPGSCGGMYTANTMASAIEALGMSLANSSAQEAVSRAKRADAERAGRAVVNLIKLGIKPSDILTREAFENAITVDDRARAVRRTPCCTCSRSRTPRACRSNSTTSRGSAPASRCSPTCGRAGAIRCRTWSGSAASSRS